MSSANSKRVIIAALIGNLAITLCKFAAALISGSTATLAEAVHSVADTGNQGLLLLGLGLSGKRDDDRFAFGRASERYFWPFVVALMLFSVGGAFAIYEGLSHLLGGHHDAPRIIDTTIVGIHLHFSSVILNYAVLGASFLFEAMSFRVAWTEFKVLSKGKPLKEALIDSRDPTIPLVLAEDTTALIGLGIALLAVILSSVTGQLWWDAVGSLIIGILLAAVAMTLARLTHGLLIGKSATIEDQASVLHIVENVEGIEKVTQMLTLHLGPDFVVLALKVAFQADARVSDLERITNALEDELRAAMPQMKKIFVEPDSKGDGRGLEAARAFLAKGKHA